MSRSSTEVVPRDPWPVILAVFPCGLLAFASFLYMGIRARHWIWVGFAALYFVFQFAALFILTAIGSAGAIGGGGNTKTNLIGLAAPLSIWFASFLHVLRLREKFARLVSARHQDEST